MPKSATEATDGHNGSGVVTLIPAEKPAPDHVSVPAMTVTSLPSPNLEHSAVWHNEISNRLQGFESGIVALQGEMEGQQRSYEDAAAELSAKHETAKADLLRRIADMRKGKAICEAALDKSAELSK